LTGEPGPAPLSGGIRSAIISTVCRLCVEMAVGDGQCGPCRQLSRTFDLLPLGTLL